MNEIQIIPPSTKFRGKSLPALRRKKRERQKGKDPPPIRPDSCGINCEKYLKGKCEPAIGISNLIRAGAYHIPKKQDRPSWMPLTDEERKIQKHRATKYEKLKLCPEPEKIASQDHVSYWDFYFGHIRSNPGAGKEHNRRSKAGAELGTYQELEGRGFNDTNTDLRGENSFETKPNWMFIIEWYFPPYHKHGRKGIREIARELNVDHGYVSREIKNLKQKLKDTIEEVLTPIDKIETKLILFKYYLEQSTQTEIAGIIGKKQNEVQRVIRRYKKKIHETLKKNVVLTYKVKG